MHADTGCPAIAYPKDMIDFFEPYSRRVDESNGELQMALSFEMLTDEPGDGPFAGMKAKQLREELSRLGLPTEGKKSELLLRLEAHLEGTAQQRRLEAKGTEEQVGQTVRLVIQPNEMVGMMSPPGAGQKPYWVFGLPLWRSYRTTHIYRQHGLPQLALQALQYAQTEVVERECEPSVCTENGKPDDDCCAISGTGGCKEGYELTETSICWSDPVQRIVSSCCIPRSRDEL